MNLHEFKEGLKDYPFNKIVFVGLGNPLRSDDAAGLVLLNRLKSVVDLRKAYFIEAGTNPENYLQKILDCPASLVVFIDTAKHGGQSGEINWLPSGQIETIAISTHTFSIKMVEKYLLSERSFDFRYCVIEPENMEMGEGLSESVKRSLNKFF
ncbi:MAG: hydrogenase maturation protease [Calditrichaceae bacterium]|jgi:hydrogenase 3 maturation protease